MKKVKCKEITDLQIRKLARHCLNLSDRFPVKILEDGSEPILNGESWYWQTRGGTRIAYPSAYSKVGWSNMVYSYSTLKATIGRRWAIEVIKIKEEGIESDWLPAESIPEFQYTT